MFGFVLLLSIFLVAPWSAVYTAEPDASAEAALAEMEEMFGGVPSLFQVYPNSAMAAGWALMKSTDLNENTALSSTAAMATPGDGSFVVGGGGAGCQTGALASNNGAVRIPSFAP